LHKSNYPWAEPRLAHCAATMRHILYPASLGRGPQSSVLSP